MRVSGMSTLHAAHWPRGVLLLALLLVALPASPVRANTLSVTNLDDSGPGSLRQATLDAAAGDTIMFGVSGTIALTSGALTLTKSVTIDAAGAAITVDGGGAGRDFFVASGVTATLRGLTIQHGAASGSAGGGIYNYEGALTVVDSTVVGNSAAFGAGIYDYLGTLTLSSSTVIANSAAYDGGGINGYVSRVTVTDSTLTGNSATSGAGIANSQLGTLTVTNSTVTANSASTQGGGIATSGILSMTNTIVAANTAPLGADVDGSVASGGHNLVGDTPLLGALGDYGGPTRSIPPLTGSPAIDAGDDAVCMAMGTGQVNSLDQRGIVRAQGAHCDIGAFEARFALTRSGGTDQSTPITRPFAQPLAVTLASVDGVGPLGGAPVSFAPPGSGATANIAGSPAMTDAVGTASVAATASGTPGTYTVTASAPGASTASFTITNTGLGGVSPATGGTAGRSEVALTGAGFGTAGNTQVLVDGRAIPAGSIESVTGMQIVYIAPAHAAGETTVTVAVDGTPLAGRATYTYVAPAALPGPKPTGGTGGRRARCRGCAPQGAHRPGRCSRSQTRARSAGIPIPSARDLHGYMYLGVVCRLSRVIEDK